MAATTSPAFDSQLAALFSPAEPVPESEPTLIAELVPMNIGIGMVKNVKAPNEAKLAEKRYNVLRHWRIQWLANTNLRASERSTRPMGWHA